VTETCHSCGDVFEDFHALALHISSSRKGHRKGKRWAAKYLAGRTLRPEIKRIAENPDHENTEFGEENRANAKREISGDNEYTQTICPNCHIPARQLIPVEYIQSDNAWREKGVLVLDCQGCRGSNL